MSKAKGGCRVSIVEDNEDVAAYLQRSVQKCGSLQWASTAHTLTEGIRNLHKYTPDIILVDLKLPDGSGIEVIHTARKSLPECECMVLTTCDEERQVVAALEAGATGYLLKDSHQQDICGEIVELMHGGSPISPAIARALLHRFRPGNAHMDIAECLTTRERDVLELMAHGHKRREIADQMKVSVHTVSTHAKHIYEKLAVGSSGEAVFEARRRGMIQ